jgi:hypothetical protein
MATLGGVHEAQGGGASAQNSVEIEGLAIFAVEEHNKKEVTFLYFSFLFGFNYGFCLRNLYIEVWSE